MVVCTSITKVFCWQFLSVIYDFPLKQNDVFSVKSSGASDYFQVGICLRLNSTVESLNFDYYSHLVLDPLLISMSCLHEIFQNTFLHTSKQLTAV